MEKYENFAENYYPKDLFPNGNNQNEKQKMYKNTQNAPFFSMENLTQLLGKNGDLSSLLMPKNLKNDEKTSNFPFDNPIFNLFNNNKTPQKTKKEEIIIDQNSFEEY